MPFSRLRAVYNHLALPPKLPGESDGVHTADVEGDILVRSVDAADYLHRQFFTDSSPSSPSPPPSNDSRSSNSTKSISSSSEASHWHTLHRALELSALLNADNRLNRATLQAALEEHLAGNDNVCTPLILHLPAQNAGLLFHCHRNSENKNSTFSVYMHPLPATAAPNKIILSGTALHLHSTHPGIPLGHSLPPGLPGALAAVLEQLSLTPHTQAHARKAGVRVVEPRDVAADPEAVTGWLATVMRALGQSDKDDSPVPRSASSKRKVRDDVCYERAALPWRRTGLWGVLRAGALGVLGNCGQQPEQEKLGRVRYKVWMCVVLARLLEDAGTILEAEECEFLIRKLGRRMAKLEHERTIAEDTLREVYDFLLGTMGPMVADVLREARWTLEQNWEEFKKGCVRRVPALPFRAHPKDLRLQLANSGNHLRMVLREGVLGMSSNRSLDHGSRDLPTSVLAAAQGSVGTLAQRHFDLDDKAADIISGAWRQRASARGDGSSCGDAAGAISVYLDAVGDVYHGDPEQMSGFILNVMELWMAMDKAATAEFPLLGQFHPTFTPNLFDVLQVEQRCDLRRLGEIQRYLQERCQASTDETIFADPSTTCFAVRYRDEADAGRKLRALERQVEAASNASRQKTLEKFERLLKEHRELTEGINTTSCSGDYCPIRKNFCRCSRCYWVRQRRKLKITNHEDFLPKTDSERHIVQRKLIIFELGIPKAFATYRDVTWRILTLLAWPPVPLHNHTEPVMHLNNYDNLCPFQARFPHSFSISSSTKSFLIAHYKNVGAFTRDEVVRPLGLTFSYYDSSTRRWARALPTRLTFAHHLKLPQPITQTAWFWQSALGPFDEEGGPPTSYQVIANQTECPRHLNMNEFTTYQTLVGSSHTRWLVILRELGSTNLNFGSEATMLLLSRLTLEAGPEDPQSPDLRAAHQPFSDARFGQRLVEQIERRLSCLWDNWREAYCVELLVTLTVRLRELGTPQMVAEGARLLETVQGMMLRWIGLLRAELRSARDAAAADRMRMHTALAALLCRRAACVLAAEKDVWTDDECTGFVRASVALQQHLTANLVSLPPAVKNMLIRDWKMVRRMRSSILACISSCESGLSAAVSDALWGDGERRTFSGWVEEESGWLRATVSSGLHHKRQTVYFNCLLGHLLVDGKPAGRLPAKISNDAAFQELFGDYNLSTLPSSLPGMDYVVADSEPFEKHQIHFGFRGGKLVIRACVQGTVLEFIERSIFGSLDLPAPLVNDCVHWLDVSSGKLEARRKPHIWRGNRPSNWIIDVHAQRGAKGRGRDIFLVDPHSAVAESIATIFRHFEDASMLTVTQSPRSNLAVELKRLDMRFAVNRAQRLQSRQLRSEIDPNQDAGTWYGLQSAIVLRDSVNHQRRSIIVPLGGDITYERNGMHVSVLSRDCGIYGRYFIDDIVGRLKCAPEPLLLYWKALYHAYTSFVLPDPLLQRTGAEEALHSLRSGCFQPWTPIDAKHLTPLMKIRDLTPVREWYPAELKCQQTVRWKAGLTTHIQNESYRPLIDRVLGKSNQLAAFSVPPQVTQYDNRDNPHLRLRAASRQQAYERTEPSAEAPAGYCEIQHKLWGGIKQSVASKNAHCAIMILLNKPSALSTTRSLASKLEAFPTIGGFDVTCSDLLEVDHAELGLYWGALVNLCRESEDKEGLYRAMFQLSMLAFDEKADMELIRTLLAFCIFPELRALELPSPSPFVGFKHRVRPSADWLLEVIRSGCMEELNKARKVVSEDFMEDQVCRCLDFLYRQWPCAEPTLNGFESFLIEKRRVLSDVTPEWSRLWHNQELSDYLDQVQEILDRRWAKLIEEELPKMPGCAQKSCTMRKISYKAPTLSSMLNSADFGDIVIWHPESQRPSSERPKQRTISNVAPSPEIIELGTIVDELQSSKNATQAQYGEDLHESLVALKRFQLIPKITEPLFSLKEVNEKVAEARQKMRAYDSSISAALQRESGGHKWLRLSGLLPTISPVTILEQLRSTANKNLRDVVKDVLLTYALSISSLQRLLRIQDALMKRNDRVAQEELNNLGHVNWNPRSYPDWLLLEVDADILIRPAQVEVALATISPAAGTNSVLQMNMGQGKTSCVIPMVVAVLANGVNLCRTIVPRSLLLQTAQVLLSRLGGLVGREVRHVPYSRRTPSSVDMTQAYRKIHEEIMGSCGVMLGLPEHTLSFNLSGLQRLSDEQIPEATAMIEAQAWLNSVCRDVLDECDVTLAVKTQLVYPSGALTSFDGRPYRWETVQALLKLVEWHLPDLQREFPGSIEVVPRAGGFPVIHLLRDDVEDALTARLTADICMGSANILSPGFCSLKRDAIQAFVSEKVPCRALEVEEAEDQKSRTNLLLLRGLLAHDILKQCLKKRWNLQYGLHPARDPIAVPFSAKGVPSEQAEWGHPDVAITLTCLAFYYTGLSHDQIRQGLQRVLSADDPSNVYDRWTHSSSLPGALRDWHAINVDDDGQLAEIHKHLRYATPVIDYYLNSFAFPAHAKQFSVKLQVSGWDIPMLSEEPRPLTTGFSGTNDNRRMLPLNIRQADLPGLAHTSALVLTHLLLRRNRAYMLAADAKGRHLSERRLLEGIHARGIRILIDVGAHILEMDNQSVAKAWLEVDHEAAGAVYFDSAHKPWILDRNNKTVPLQASPYAENLEGCLVYLDEAHTRGTDLRLPVAARGALTLGLGQTKDHTVQAAMRLRQLGTTQSVTFLAGPEVHQSIMDLRGKRSGEWPDSFDVLVWLIRQTVKANEQLQQLYFAQGTDFCRRMDAAWKHRKFLTDRRQREAFLRVLRRPEEQTLEQLYTPASDCPEMVGHVSHPSLRALASELRDRQRTSRIGQVRFGSAFEQVEQEREVAFEVEQTREVQRPVRYKALVFPGLSKAIKRFLETGELRSEWGFEHAFEAIARTGPGRKYESNPAAAKSRLYISTEMSRTVVTKGRAQDNFLRPVSWILFGPRDGTALIIIPEEAEAVIPILRRQGKQAKTHLILYAPPVTKAMLHFNRLKYYALPALPDDFAIPAWLGMELGLFAGRLYFHADELPEVTAYLHHDAASCDSDVGTQEQPFVQTPLSFLQEWLALRRKDQEFAHTPMGFLCQRLALRADHAFFHSTERAVAGEGIDASRPALAGGAAVEVSEGGSVDDESDGYSDVEMEDV